MSLSSNKIAPLKFIDNNCLLIEYHEQVHIELADMEAILSSVKTFTGHQPTKRLVIISKNATIAREARAFLQEENHKDRKQIIAEAVIVNSLAQKMATNFYLSFIKDDFPSRFFTDLTKAKEWLNGF